MSIVFADDDAFIQKIAGTQLGNLGEKVEIVGDGAQAVEKFRADPDCKLVILDLTMPVMSGSDACKEIRKIQGSNGNTAKVIALTGDDDDETKAQSKADGFDDLLGKPLKGPKLKEYL